MILSAQTIRARVEAALARVRREHLLIGSLDLPMHPGFADSYFSSVGELMIMPFNERRVAEGKTFGLSSAGYDVRLAQTLWVWPFWGRLGSIMEYIDLPPDLTCIIRDKSSNARRFITVQNTTAEPGWRGYLTVEITRHLPWPVRLKKGTPIAQLVFELLDRTTDQPYQGRYQNQPPRPVKAKEAMSNA